MDLTLLNHVSYGLYIIAVNDGGRPTGCIINTCMQITSENPIFAVCVNKDNYTYEVLQKTKKFSLSILSEKSNPKIIGDFGFFSGRDRNKFEPYRYKMVNDLPVLEEACPAVLLFDVMFEQDMETHAVIYARLAETLEGEKVEPMTYAYYHRVIKGKAPKSAPTYQAPVKAEKKEEPKPEKKVSYICQVCGYVYEGDLTQEPDDYTCPLCGVGKDLFELQKQDTENGDKVSYVCKVCGYVHEGELSAEPEDYRCPVCGVGKEQFEKLK